MSKEKAIEICRNLEQSIEMAGKRAVREYEGGVSTNPSADYRKLKRKKEYIIEKYKLTKKDLK